MRGALPGTQILMDGKPLGTANSRGNFSITGLSEGRKRILLRKKNYRTREVTVTVAAGKEAVLEGAVLERAEGLLIFEALQPREISMTLEPAVGAEDYSGPRQFAQLPPQQELVAGTYNLTFSARGYVPETYTVEVSDRETKRIPVRLKKR
ncbi:MAG: hypothetical protein M1541_07005 [Acidobacteria bacterium]|nr:hypothetical protein [Acidobacteriota bacterium]